MKRATDDFLSQLFVLPWGVRQEISGLSLRSIATKVHVEKRIDDDAAISESWVIEQAARSLFGLRADDIKFIHDTLGPHVEEYSDSPVDETFLALNSLGDKEVLAWLKDHGIAGRQYVNQSYHSSRKTEIISHLCKVRGSTVAKHLAKGEFAERSETKEIAKRIVDWAIGICVGHWDVRLALGQKELPSLPSPVDILPRCSPGRLKDHDDLPLTTSPQEYPLRIDWDGIFVDDPEHPDDIIRRVRDVLELIWKDRADAIENEACEILGVADLRDYFRKPGVGGFWDDHIKRYSKSRRKAPIYWLLQSSKKNYALWIYYHRLDKDILFKALLNYVEPKIRREESRLDELRSQKTALGTAAKGAKKLDKDIDRQDSFLSELRDFEEKLRRAANLRLDPDLNDGVVLNIAPLRELVPWKEAKSYWDDLMDGKYEWSSIGKQLREKGIVPC
jgi:hypothetical protein